LKWQMATW